MTFDQFFEIADRCLELVEHRNRDIRETAHMKLKRAKAELDATPAGER